MAQGRGRGGTSVLGGQVKVRRPRLTSLPSLGEGPWDWTRSQVAMGQLGGGQGTLTLVPQVGVGHELVDHQVHLP